MYAKKSYCKEKCSKVNKTTERLHDLPLLHSSSRDKKLLSNVDTSKCASCEYFILLPIICTAVGKALVALY